MEDGIMVHFKNQQEYLEELLQFEDMMTPAEVRFLKEAIFNFECITGVNCDYDFWRKADGQ